MHQKKISIAAAILTDSLEVIHSTADLNMMTQLIAQKKINTVLNIAVHIIQLLMIIMIHVDQSVDVVQDQSKILS